MSLQLVVFVQGNKNKVVTIVCRHSVNLAKMVKYFTKLQLLTLTLIGTSISNVKLAVGANVSSPSSIIDGGSTSTTQLVLADKKEASNDGRHLIRKGKVPWRDNHPSPLLVFCDIADDQLGK